MTNTEVLEQVSPLPIAEDPHLVGDVKAFLTELNKGPALETLSPKQARLGLVDGQAAVKVDLSGIEVSEKTITADGYQVVLNIVRPAGVQGTLPVFVFIHGAAGSWAISQPTSGWCVIWSF